MALATLLSCAFGRSLFVVLFFPFFLFVALFLVNRSNSKRLRCVCIFIFCFQSLQESRRKWVGLGWVGLGWVGLGWVGLGWVGLGWIKF
jgi:hypothetical protein